MLLESVKGRIQAAHIIKSHLNALSIAVRIDDASRHDFIVVGKADSDVGVTLGASNAITEGGCTVSIMDVLSPENEVILNALHVITELAGYGKPLSVDRGEAPETRINYHDQYEEVLLRHNLLRRSPNPSNEDMRKYMPIIKRVAANVFYKFGAVFSSMGMGHEDLVSIGMVHTISFLHNYAYDADPSNNARLLSEFLFQRLTEGAKVTFKKALNCTCLPQAIKRDGFYAGENGEEDVYSKALNMIGDEGAARSDADFESGIYILEGPNGKMDVTLDITGAQDVDIRVNGESLTAEGLMAIKDGLAAGTLTLTPKEEEDEDLDDDVSISDRRQTARHSLYEKLGAMDAETRETTLAYAALSRDYPSEARSFARKLCDEMHCPSCGRRVQSELSCPRCNVGAVPRYGVDYLGVRDRLRADHDSLAEAMTAPVTDNEVRARKHRQEILSGTTAVPLVTLSAREIDDLVKKYRDELMASLPETMVCTNCKEEKHKTAFGVRVPRRKYDKMPMRACKISRCKSCRREGTYGNR